MAFALKDYWVWDHWILTGETGLDMFYLHAPKALGDPALRHAKAAIGHARSVDGGLTWQVLPSAVRPSLEAAFDDRATWTGSAIRLDDGRIRLFYTGVSRGDRGRFVQRIGWADSTDGVRFEKMTQPPIVADPEWYEVEPDADVAWRDPFVFRGEDCWHMLVTARANSGEHLTRGTIGHCVSDDLESWRVCEPLSGPSGFGHLECAQSRRIDSGHVLVFSCGPDMQQEPGEGTVWIVPGQTPLGPWDFAARTFVEPRALYAGQLFERSPGDWAYTGFDSFDDAQFSGTVPDPIPLAELTRR